MRKLCESGMRGTMRSMQGKEKSPELRAFLGSGDLTRTDDTPGMNFMRNHAYYFVIPRKSLNLAIFCRERFIAFQYFSYSMCENCAKIKADVRKLCEKNY